MLAHLLPLTFFVIFILTFFILLVATKTSHVEQAVVVRLRAIRNPQRSLASDSEELELDSGHTRGLAHRLGVYLRQYRISAGIEELLLQADSQRTAGEFALTSLTSAALTCLTVLLVWPSFVHGLLAVAAGLMLPWSYTANKRRRRLQAMMISLPDASDLMARAMRAGHSLTQAIEIMGLQAPPPLAAEFARVFQQQTLGVPLREVLVELGRRVPSRDLQFLITAIMVQRETGGDLAEILDRTAQLLRERIRVKGEVQVYTAQGRLTGWILALLPVALLLLISLFSPDYSRILFHDPIGRRLLLGGGVFIATGAFVISRIVRIEL